ncbi:hypothetical protein [Nannocystis sp. SCPEA4]|uniref:hypothetical protein n=1 Tax=Nannocystis sp. SCPEA4 TaxID=2996787 RepID=UPI00226FAC0C|nr:hypothetical protein [Nannocystis sp. SCPEA4]MCY1059414.1 hypothetical protein [Nannocystis sp. SCPEA4]
MALVACGSTRATTDGDTTGDGGTTSGGETTGDAEVLVGSFQISLVAPIPAAGDTPATPGKTTVLGKVYDGPVPEQIVWEEAASAGDCRLLTPRIPLCSTPCGGSAVCVEDETCRDYPTAGSVGTVTVEGLRTEGGDDPFTMDPVANTYQPGGSVKLAYPAFAEGDAIHLEAPGDVLGGFSVDARGIAPLELVSEDIELASGAAITLAWEAAAQPELSTIHVKLDISHHGGTKGKIVCAAADTGALEIGADLVTDLLALGVAGFPSIIVTREHVGSTTIAQGRIDLVIGAGVERFVTIEGLTSCSDDSQCSAGQTCQPDLTCA